MKILYKLMTLIFVALFAIPSIAGAQEGGSGGISISPTRFEFVIERGQAELATIQVENVTDQPMIARAFLNDFEPDGNTGSPNLIIDSEEQSSSSLRDFIIGIEDVRIEAGETARVNLPIQVPENAAPGAYYGAVRFQASPVDDSPDSNDDDSAQLSLNASVAAIVLVEVPGNITEKIEISDVSAYLDDESGTFFTKKPNQVGIEINNLGNGFSKPFGAVVINGPWGAGEVYTYELNDTNPRGNVLPNSKRLFLNEIEEGAISMPGRYTIIGNISHGNGGEILEVTSTFWYLPSWFLIVLLLVVLLLVGIIYYLYRKYSSGSKSHRRR